MKKYWHRRPTIGVLPSWPLYTEGALSGYLGPILRGIFTAASERDCNLLVAGELGPITRAGVFNVHPVWPEGSPNVHFVPVGPWNTDGFIVIAPLLAKPASNYIQKNIRDGFPVVFIARGEQGASVLADSAGGIRQALEHLAWHGHRRIAYLAGDPLYVGEAPVRLDAYQRMVAELGLDADPRLVVHNLGGIVYYRQAVLRLLEAGVEFTAMLTYNDEAAIGAMQAFKELGISVPEKVAVIGFDDEMEAAAQVPPLTSVYYPKYESGYQAVELLLKQIDGHGDASEVVQIPTRLIIRQSCGCLPGGAVLPGSGGFTGSLKPIELQTPRPTAFGEDEQTESPVQAMIEAVLRESPRLERVWVRQQSQRLFEALHSSLDPRNAMAFQLTLIDILKLTDAMGDSAYIWQTAISVLKQYSTGPLASWQRLDAARLVEETLDQARIIVSDSLRWRSERHIVLQRDLDSSINAFSAQLLTVLDEVQILSVLDENLPSLGVQQAEVFFFAGQGEDPVAWSMPALTKPGNEPQCFPSREFPPPAWRSQLFRLALLPLVVQDELAGYVAFSADNIAPCEVIVQELAAALRSARLYREATQARQLAEEANRLKGHFLSLVSHELRTPLSVITGLSEIVLREQTRGEIPLPEQYRQDIEHIHASAEHLGWMIRDVLDLTSGHAGQLRLTCEPLDLGEVFRVVTAAGEAMARERGLHWEAHIPTNLPLVWGDRTRLREVALNLVSNAVKFTAQGEVTLQVEVQGTVIRVEVRDSGLGIPPEEQRVIFDEFRQSERSAKRGYGGLGLGLAVSRQFVEMHGGQIGVESSGQEGQGSTFFFTLPVMETAALNSTPTPSILLLTRTVDGNERLGNHLREQDFDASVLVLHENADWLSQVVACLPSTIIVDSELASTDGWAIIKILKEHPATQHIPVLFYSLSPGEETGTLLEMDYLTKPVEATKLYQALAQQGLTTDQKVDEKTILIVDDDLTVLDLHARMVQLHSADHKILKAHNGQEALAMLKQDPVDLVLLDLMMPEMDGFSVLEAMRSNEATRGIPVIVLTAQVLSEANMARLNRGVAVVLQKGLLNTKEMLAQVETVLRRNRKIGSEAQWLVRKTMAYIHAHYMEPISMEDILQNANVSDSYLQRCFQREITMSPISYLNRYRIRQAKELLVLGDQSVFEVAMATGFSSASYFSRIFKREEGMSPQAYRLGGVRPSEASGK